MDSHVDAALSRDEQNRPVRIACLQTLQKLKSRNFGHHHVADDDVRILAVNNLASLNRIAGLKRLKPPTLQQDRQRFPNAGVIVDDQNLSLSCSHYSHL